MPETLLVADDEYGIREFLYELFKDEFAVLLAENGQQAIEMLSSSIVDVALIDMRMPIRSGMEVLEFINAQKIPVIPIVITADRDIQHAVDAMKLGVFDYITKPVDYQKLVILVRNALEQKRLRDRVNLLEKEIRPNYTFENIVGESKAMQAVFDTLRNVIDNDATVLLYGESGTGKEIVARAIHFNSGRRQKPFVPMDCASIPATLFETELFGFEKGAFTGANKTTRGKFEIANTGTLFLDEVSNISLDAQAKLLRILQEREFSRIGGEAKIAVDVRLISASNKRLPELIRSGEFREDLFYRLNVIPINLPSLRERKEDVPLLIETFLSRFNRQYNRDVKFGASVMKALLNYSWPGNVRELENFVHRVVLTAESGIVNDAETLREFAEKPVAANLRNDALDQDVSLETLEKLHIEKMLKRHHHNISGVSKILGLTRKTLYAKMEKYGIKSGKD